MSILSFISNIFAPVAKVIDDVHTSTEEKLQLKNELAKVQADVQTKLIELEGKAIEADTKIREAEASSSSWLTQSWRPICSILIVALIVLGSFGVVTVTSDIYELAKIFLGVYGGGRSIEKLGEVFKLGKQGVNVKEYDVKCPNCGYQIDFIADDEADNIECAHCSFTFAKED